MVTQVLNHDPPLLGTYTLPGGTVLPAVGIGAITPDDWVTQGLEITVPWVSESDNLWTSRRVKKTQTWDLVLVQHGSVPGETSPGHLPHETDDGEPHLASAVARLEQFFPCCHTVPLPPLGEFDNLPQARVTFETFETVKVLNHVYTP